MDEEATSGKREHIWEEGKFRIFLSHLAGYKDETATLEKQLKIFGIDCFVAHLDIAPTREWQSELLTALSTMDALIALITKKFHDSEWTDQEIGYALGRDVPIISVNIEEAPKGFIGKFQALLWHWGDTPIEIIKLLLKSEKMKDAYIKAIQNCTSFDNGNELATALPLIDKLSDPQIDLLISAFNENHELKGSWGFNGEYSTRYGSGLAFHLKRLTDKPYKLDSYMIVLDL